MKRSTQRTIGELTDSEKAWIIIKSLGEFTINDLMDESSISRANAQRLVSRLQRDGYLEKTGRIGKNGQRGSWACYRLVKRPDDVPSCVSTRTIAWRRQVWNALRIKRTVTVPEIMTTFTADVDVAYATVYRYVRRLERAGYVRAAGRSGRSGQSMSHKRYVLARNTGPTPPSRKELIREIESAQESLREGRGDD